MSAKKRKSRAKEQNQREAVEKTVPSFEDIYDAFLDSYAFISVGLKVMQGFYEDADDARECAAVVLQHGVKLLNQASGKFHEANLRLYKFCKQNKLEREDPS